LNDPIRDRVQLAVEAALDKKAFDLDVLSVEKVTSIADYFILCTGNSERQTQTIAGEIVDRLRAQARIKPLVVEGMTPGHWILVDFGDFIIHVFTEDCRRFYGLERLWGDAPYVTADFTAVEPRRNEGM
jgi:ribosome-associated protein